MDQTAAFLLTDFGREFGLPDLSLDADGYCVLKFDDIELLLHHQEAAREFLASAVIRSLPASPGEEFYAQLLELNHGRALHKSGVLGIDRVAKTVVYLDRWPVPDMSQQEFQERIRLLLEAIRVWRDWLAQFETSRGSPLDPAALETMIRI